MTSKHVSKRQCVYKIPVAGRFIVYRYLPAAKGWYELGSFDFESACATVSKIRSLWDVRKQVYKGA